MKPIIQKAWMAIALLSLSIPVFAYDFEADGYYFNITDETNKEVEVTYKDTSYSSYSGVANIPGKVKYDGNIYSVTSIGKNAFRECNDLESAVIPNTVKTIGEHAFRNCYMNSLEMGASLSKIDRYAFNDYPPISKIIWLCNTPPEGVWNVKASINYVSNNQFKLYNQIVYPFLSSKFEVDGVVYVPVSPSDRTCDVIDCNYAPTSTDIKIDDIVVNKGVELKVLDVNDYSFYGNHRIKSLLANNNGCIGKYAFYNCDALTTLEAKNEGCIGYRAFENCDALTYVVANNNGNIGGSAFYDCVALTSVLANNNGNIGDNAFESCKNLKNLTLGNAITNIGQSAFSGCLALPTVSIPDNISIGSSVFSGCSALESIYIGTGLSTIPEFAFSYCRALRSLSIPGSIYTIGNYAFWGCISLCDVIIDRFDENAHPTQSFPSWTSTNNSNYSTSFKEYSFDVIPGDVLSLDYYLNSKSQNDYLIIKLDGVEIVKEENSKWGHYRKMFETRKHVTLHMAYIIDGYGDVSDNASVNNIVLNDEMSVAEHRTLNVGSNGSKSLFSSCPLNEVYIGRKLSYDTSSDCGYSPFYRNTSLRSVKITDAETQIYDNEFYGCSNLQEFSCGDGVESIGKWAFSGCSAMKTYASGSNVKTIGDEAFSDCTGLTSFSTSAAVPPTCGNQSLDDINKWECVLHVPSESIDDYKATDQWKEFFFVEPTSGIENVAVDGTEVKVSVGDGGFSFGGDVERNVEVYSIDGQLQYSATVQPGEKVSLPAGLYIVRIDMQTVKVRI